MKRFTYAGLLFLSTSCGVGSPGTEGGTTTAGPCNCTVENGLDAGQANPDSGAAEVDAGLTPDGGNPDSGVPDAGPPPPPALASGTRLKVIYWTSPDGLRAPRYTDQFWDSEKQVRCTVGVTQNDGATQANGLRCMPSAALQLDTVAAFEDSQCTMAVTLTHRGSQPEVPVEGAFMHVSHEYGVSINLVGAQMIGDVYGSMPGGACFVMPNGPYFRIGADVTTQFAQVTETIDL